MVSKLEKNGGHVTMTSFKRGPNGKYVVSLKLDSRVESFNIVIRNDHGVFAVELPPSLSLRLRDYPVSESKALVGAIRSKHRSLS